MKKAYTLVEVSVILFFIILLSGITYVTFFQSKADTKYNQVKTSLSALSAMQKNYYDLNSDYSTDSNVILSTLGDTDGFTYTITNLGLSTTDDFEKISVSKNISSISAKFGGAVYDGSYCYRLLLTYTIADKKWSEEISRTTTLTCSGDNITQ